MSSSTGPRPSTIFNRYSFSFDGTDDFVNIGTTSLGITTAISISAWVKIPTTNTGGGGANIQEIICEDTTGGSNRNWSLLWRHQSVSNKYFQFAVFHTNGSVSVVASTGLAPNDGNWHHLLATYDGTSNANGLKLYVDGTLFQTTAGSTGIRSTSSVEPSIGSLTNGSSWFFEGNIDEVAIWNSDQSANITSIYNNGVPQSLASLNPLGWWRMGDNATWNGSNWSLLDSKPAFSIKSILLDGVDDFVSTGLNLSYTTYPNVSFSCWIKMDKASLNTFTSYSPTGAYVQTFPNSSPIRIYTDGSKNAYVRVQGNGTSNTTTDLADGNWHHIVQTCRYEATGTVCNVYIDGVQEITNQLFLSYATITGDFFVGARTATTQFFLGGIDEVAVFDSELAQSDITAIYNGGTPNDLSSLTPLGWWRCGDGDTSPTLTDNGSGGNDGTMTNFNTFSTEAPTLNNGTSTNMTEDSRKLSTTQFDRP